MVVVVREYLDSSGRSPFARWFDGLNAPAAAKVATAITRLESGNFSNVKGVGAGILRMPDRLRARLPGVLRQRRRYVVILVAGGSKKHQHDDIQTAQDRWKDYKRRKAQEK